MTTCERNTDTIGEAAASNGNISESMALHYLEYAPDGVLLLSSDGVYEYANDTICRMLGYSKEEIIGKKYDTIMDAVNVRKVRNPFKPRNAIGIHYDEYRLIRKDNSKFIALVSVSEVDDKYLVFVKDIDGYVQSKRELIIANESKAQEIAELSRKYQLIVENTSDGIMLFENGKISYVSDNYLKILGYEREEEIGRNRSDILSLIHPEDRNRIDKMTEFAMESKLPKLLYEYRAKHKAGHFIWREDTTTFVYNDKGEVKKCLIVARDISSRKATEQDLMKRMQKYRNIFENIQDVYYEIGLDGTIMEASPSIYRLTNNQVRREEIIGNSIYQFYTDEQDREKFLCEILKADSLYNYRIRFVNRDGSARIGCVMAQLIRDKDGIPLKIVGSIRDVTETINAQEQIEELNKSLKRKVLEQTMALQVHIEDLEIRNAELKTLNRQADHDARQILKLNEKLLIAQRELELANENLEQKVQERTEELSKAKDTAETANKIKSALMRNLSHEIRTPLNGMLGCTDIIANEELNRDEKREIYACLKLSANRMLQTATDILNMSLIHSGEVEVKSIEFSPKNLIEELYEVYLNSAERNKAIELRMRISDEAESAIMQSDEQKIFQILSIFVNNAIKFTHSGSVELRLNINSEQAEFSVNDTGIGIPDAELQKIFESFYQQDLSHTRRYEGNGLGLAIAKGYADIIKGKICVSSQVGEGSTFTLILPWEAIISS